MRVGERAAMRCDYVCMYTTASCGGLSANLDSRPEKRPKKMEKVTSSFTSLSTEKCPHQNYPHHSGLIFLGRTFFPERTKG